MQARAGSSQPDWPLARVAGLVTKDFEGLEGWRDHMTRRQDGTIPTSVIEDMEGVMGELPGDHRNRQGERWDDFLADIKANGIRDPILITVDWDEEPQIAEGNHRRDAAVELGLSEVPVEIRYFGHAEEQTKVAMIGDQSDVEGAGEPTTDHQRYWYHMTKSDNRDSIMATGLEADRSLHGKYTRIYLAKDEWNPAGEQHARGDGDGTTTRDVWRVDTQDIPIRPDPELPDKWGIAEVDISPDRLTLVKSAAKTGTVIPGWSFAKVAQFEKYYRGIVYGLEAQDAALGRALMNGTATAEQVVRAVSTEGYGAWFAADDLEHAKTYAYAEEVTWDEEYSMGELGVALGCTVAGQGEEEILELEPGDPVTVTDVWVGVIHEQLQQQWHQLSVSSPIHITADKADDASELLPGGGFTLSLHGNVPRWGWMVSLRGTEEKFDFPPSRDELQGYIDKWATELAPSNRYWGGERRGGTVNLDVSECIDDQDEAMAYGREQGQERIYNLGSGQYIKLTGAKRQVTTRFYIHTDTPVDEVERFIKSLPEDEIVERNESLFAVGVPPSGSDLVREFAVTPAGDDFFAGEADDISRSYRDLPINDPNVDPLWKELGELCRAQADALRVTMDIQVVTDHDPYANAAQMHADMDKGIYQVTTLHSDHPVWDVDTNVAFRIAHDVLGHGVAYSDFSFRGEVEAYQAQCGVTPRRLWPVLFTEVIAQSAYANTHHLFGEQKVGLIPLTQEEINAQVGKVMDAPDPAYDATHRSAALDKHRYTVTLPNGVVYETNSTRDYTHAVITQESEESAAKNRLREPGDWAVWSMHGNEEVAQKSLMGITNIPFAVKRVVPVDNPRSAKLSKLSAADHAGSMVALVPPESMRGALEQEGGEPVENMHVTIVYIGKEKFEEAQAAVEEYVIIAPQLRGRVGGFGIFEASETSDNKQVLVALMDIPHLDEWRVGLLKVLKAHGVEPPDNHGFTPHTTIAYTDDPKIPDMPEGAKDDFVIDQILFSAGEEDTYYALGGARTSAAIAGWPLARVAGSYTFDVDFVKDLDQLKDGVTADGTHRVTVEAETWPEAETLAAQIVGSTQGVPTATRRVR